MACIHFPAERRMVRSLFLPFEIRKKCVFDLINVPAVITFIVIPLATFFQVGSKGYVILYVSVFTSNHGLISGINFLIHCPLVGLAPHFFCPFSMVLLVSACLLSLSVPSSMLYIRRFSSICDFIGAIPVIT